MSPQGVGRGVCRHHGKDAGPHLRGARVLTWLEVSRRDGERKVYHWRNVLIMAQAGGPPKDLFPVVLRGRTADG